MRNWLQKRDKLIFSPYLKVIKDRISSYKGKCIMLEIGCGRGNSNFVNVYKQCSEIIGVDLDKVALDENKYISKKIHTSIEKLDLKSNSVDIIIATWVFEHIENPRKCINNLYRVLKKGGSLIFITPNKNSLPSILSRIMPNFLHSFVCKILYKRSEKDTYRTFYKLNSKKDMEIYFKKFFLNQIIMHDDLKFFGSLWVFRPVAILWNYIIMTKFMKNFRAIIIAEYIKK